MSSNESNEERRIACVGTYPPRRCGIATFTKDLCNAIETQSQSKQRCHVIAVNDRANGHDYPDNVRFEIRQHEPADYRLAADFASLRNCELMLVEHEYGIFGGPDGEHLLSLLRNVRMPVVVTMHTVLPDPPRSMQRTTQKILNHADRVVVMSQAAAEILRSLYEIPPDRVHVIPHGIPDLSFVAPSFYKDQFGVEGKTVLLTFGLLSPGKGIEYAIRALPDLIAQHPDLVYLIVGATHPHVLREHGEQYRHQLQHLAEDLGVLNHIVFHNRYVDLDELCKFLMAADIYLTPSLAADQIASGTLAYAMGAGKAVIATGYTYAKELLGNDRGRIVGFQDSQAIAQEVGALLDDPIERQGIAKRAYLHSRDAIWSNVADQYLSLFDEVVRVPSFASQRQRSYAVGPTSTLHAVPEFDFSALKSMTDDVGILQHANHTIADRHHGYCTDDNARALVVALQGFRLTHDAEMMDLAKIYLAFVQHALNLPSGRFRNFMGYDRRWTEETGSEDSHARALWALGFSVSLADDAGMRAVALDLFDRALHAADRFQSPRAWAFTLVGVDAYLSRYRGDSEAKRIGERLANRLYARFEDGARPQWVWPEETLTYSCGKLPHALLLSGQWMDRDDLIDQGLRCLDWLLRVQTSEEGHLSFVGNQGWYPRGGTKAGFDQQPIEAHALLEACLVAHSITQDDAWFVHARRCFDWFLGRNDLGAPLFDYRTGGCRDGLHCDGVNANEGAESILAWLLSLRAIRAARLIEPTAESHAEEPQTMVAANE